MLAALLGGASALLGDLKRRERVYVGCHVFVASVAAVIGGSWIMYLVHG